MTEPRETRADEFKGNLIILGSFLAIFWGLEIIDTAMSHKLDMYGIRPRSADGLLGILFAPFLHGSWDHLSANTIPFAVLGFFTILYGRTAFWWATVWIVLIGGIGTWLTGGANSVHIGASGLIFGYFGFLIATGVLERSLKGILIAVFVGFVYGSIVWGVLPSDKGISWQGHLFGLIGGGAAAWLAFRKAKKIKSTA